LLLDQLALPTVIWPTGMGLACASYIFYWRMDQTHHGVMVDGISGALSSKAQLAVRPS